MSHDTTYNERELLKLVAGDDEAAFGRLFNQYRNKIYTVAYKLTHSSLISEEIVQDVFLKIWIKRSGLMDIANFDSYLFVIAQNKTYEVLRRSANAYQKDKAISENDCITKEDGITRILEKECTYLLQSAISQLPYQQEKVFRLVKEQGLKREQVAQLLQVKSETVKSHLAEAMKNIRAFCKDYIGLLLAVAFFMLYHSEK